MAENSDWHEMCIAMGRDWSADGSPFPLAVWHGLALGFTWFRLLDILPAYTGVNGVW